MKEDEFAIEFCVRFWVCYNIIKMTKQFYNNITPIQPAPVIDRFAFTTGQAGRNYERERVKSLRDFDLEFHTFNNLKRYFYSAFLIAQNYV